MLVENTVKSRLLKNVVQILIILFSLNNNFVSYYSSHSYSWEKSRLRQGEVFVQSHRTKNVSKPSLFNSTVLSFTLLYNINIAFHLRNGVGKSIFIEKSINLKLNIFKAFDIGLMSCISVTVKVDSNMNSSF